MAHSIWIINNSIEIQLAVINGNKPKGEQNDCI